MMPVRFNVDLEFLFLLIYVLDHIIAMCPMLKIYSYYSYILLPYFLNKVINLDYSIIIYSYKVL